ncbi:MAG TPA: HlyD family efflux transporter periplasmic adaptor subunit, partial [Anaerolineae bacterium]|nr:HlyD family efflux transporter periplasmic adaptor subunit [Anaerolineae bacterium]
GDTLVILDDRILEDQVSAAQAGVEAAQATLDDADTSAEKKTADAQLKQAEAALSTAEIQQSYAVVKSPVDGIVLSLPLGEGEMASPGSTLAVIGKLSALELTIYVDEKELGKVKVGQEAVVKVDTFSDKKFAGRVTEIASEAEFTPQNVQTKEQRSNLVFGVTIKVDNADDLLKPGMPADAELK